MTILYKNKRISIIDIKLRRDFDLYPDLELEDSEPGADSYVFCFKKIFNEKIQNAIQYEWKETLPQVDSSELEQLFIEFGQSIKRKKNVRHL